jgi:hypothetical protein
MVFMVKRIFPLLTGVLMMVQLHAQNRQPAERRPQTQGFGLHAGLILLENPFVLYPFVNVSYAKTVLGSGRHQLALQPQLGVVFLPGIENRFLFSVSAAYKYVSKARFEAGVYGGLNYQLRRLAYDRYAFENGGLKNKGRNLHQVGPLVGFNLGYKIIKKQNYSISPVLDISFIKLNKNYTPDFFAGYKPVVSFGFNLNK